MVTRMSKKLPRALSHLSGHTRPLRSCWTSMYKNSLLDGAAYEARTGKKDKVDSLKRRYKAEKRKAVNGEEVTWPFFDKLDDMMGSALRQTRGFKPIDRLQRASLYAGLEIKDYGDDEHENKQGYSGSPEGEWQRESRGQGRRPPPPWPGASSKSRARTRETESDSSVQALADAITGFSEVYARVELAKLEIMTTMKLEFAKLARKRRRRHRRGSSSRSSSTNHT
ncbi:hypothetical protein GOP47_0016697 [Adiantum capillus-veneris]|uniref:MADF domain-containing protein n=1 Tax=Adiantum capillus-veneris TaxID=13818 RepID=A0A9D4UIT9_ADICA|nr:hypothetical protein GOP47_0016697 [Adiantum capillus-veneris]